MAGPTQANADLWKGTSVLLATNLVYRVVDFVYRVYLVRLVGAEVIGLFQVVLPVYLTLLLLAGAGVSPAVANLVAERVATGDVAGCRRVVRTALRWNVLAGTLSAGGLIALAEFAAVAVLRDARVYLALLAVAPALLVVSVQGIFRGYFQGRQRMGPIAVAQLSEQATGVAVVLPLLVLLAPGESSLKLAVLGVGMTAGEIVSLVTLLHYWGTQREALPWRSERQGTTGGGNVLARLLRLAAPISASRLLGTASLAANAFLIPARLVQSGYTRREAMSLYGQLTGMAMPLVSFPAIVTFALAFNLVPTVSALQACSDYAGIRRALERALWLTEALALPVAVTLVLLPHEVSFLAYRTATPAPALFWMAIGSPLLYLEHVMSGVLQGLGRPSLALRNFAVGEGVSLLISLWLVPPLGLAGTGIGFSVGAAAEAALDYRAATRLLPDRPSLPRVWASPLVAGGVMAVTMLALARPLQAALGYGAHPTLTLVAAGAAVYLGVLLLLGAGGVAWARPFRYNRGH